MPMHKIEFAPWGMRIAVLKEDGTLEHEAEFELDEQFGNVLPAVGDFFCLIGPGRDHDQPMQVVARYWVSDFGSDTCWWVIVKELPIDPIAKATFKLARKVAKEFREVEARRSELAYESLDAVATRLREAKGLKKLKPSRGQTTSRRSGYSQK